MSATYQKFSEVFDLLTGEDEIKQSFMMISARLENPAEDQMTLFCDLDLRRTARALAVSEPGVLALLALPQAAKFLVLICGGKVIQVGQAEPSFWIHREEMEHRLSSMLPKAMLVLREMGFDREWRASWMTTLLCAARVPLGCMERFTKLAC